MPTGTYLLKVSPKEGTLGSIGIQRLKNETKKGDLSWLKISAFVTHQVQQGFYTLVMLVQHCLTTFMHVIMVVHSLSVLKILTVNVTLKMVSVHSLITCVGWELTGMKVLKHTKTIVNQNVYRFTKNILINFWQKVKPISHT